MGLAKNVNILINKVINNLGDVTRQDPLDEIDFSFQEAQTKINAYSAQIKRSQAELGALHDQKEIIEKKIATASATALMAVDDRNEAIAKKAIAEKFKYSDQLLKIQDEINAAEEALNQMKISRTQMHGEFRAAKLERDKFANRLKQATAQEAILSLQADLKTSMGENSESVSRLKNSIYFTEASVEMKREDLGGNKSDVDVEYEKYQQRAVDSAIDDEYVKLLREKEAKKLA